MISGRGYQSARIMLIADGASEEDVGHGYALSGNQEKILKGYCNDNKIRWEELWLTALIKERINLKKPKDNEHFLINSNYISILRDEITTIQPNIIVPLSELSFSYLTNLHGIRKFRGSVLPPAISYLRKPARIIPILGPNPYLNEDYKLHYITRLDFAKVAKNQFKEGPIEEIGRTWIAKTSGQLREFFERQWLKKPEFVVFDIETSWDIPHCISFCFDGYESVTAPILDYTLPLDDRVLMMRFIAQLLASPLPKVNQNIKFDWKKLERFGFYVENVSGDTLLAASCLYSEFPKNLGFLTSLYTDMPYFKDEGKQFDPSANNRDKLYLYCAKDSLATHQIYTQQKTELKELGVEKPYSDIIRILPIYKRGEERGIRLDESQRRALHAKYTTLFDMQVFKVRRLVNNYELNPLSPAQVRKIIFNDLEFTKIRGIKTTKNGEPSTDEESLELLMWMGHSPYQDANLILKSFINCRKLHKVIEYIETLIHPDGRMRTEFNLGGTENGRTSASETTDGIMVLDDYYSNKKPNPLKTRKVEYDNLGRSFQTISKHGFEIDGEDLGKDLRSMFIPSPGYCFVENDLSQAEARVDAVLANDFDILKIFDGPIGIHRLTGSWLYQCPPDEIKKNTLVNGVDRYHEAKTARHAGERNMKEDRLMMMIHQPIARCRQILATFHDKQPNIRRVFHKEVYEKLYKERKLVAPDGSRRDFFGRFDHHMVNEGISFLPQVIVTRYMKAAIGPVFETMPDCWLLNEAHDGILSEVPLGKEKEFGSLFKKTVEVGIDFRNCSLSRDFELVIPSECDVSYTNWMEMKTLDL